MTPVATLSRFARKVVLAFALAAAVTSAPADSRAQPEAGDAEAERRAKVVLRVGAHAVTVGQLEDHLAGIHPLQLDTFGKAPEAVARGYVEQVLVRDLLLASGAEKRKLADKLPTSHQLARARSSATLRAVRRSVPTAAQLPPDDVRAYYEKNRASFDSPQRIHLSRLLLASRDEAEQVLATAKRDLSIAKWNELARDKSIDKATHLRGGNLGFVGPDGTSNEAGLSVDPALVRAAERVKDGELVPSPVAEGESFAVVWRRGTVPASKRTLEEAEAQIRTTLYRQRTEAAERALIEELRRKLVSNVDEGLLGIVELRPFDAGLSLPRSPPSPRPSR
jgi:peptidyl-prolyl cis-trans isomerase C